MAKYVVYGVDGDEKEELDWTYSKEEAERWVKEFGEERDKWIAEGKDPGNYWAEYVMEEVEEGEEGENGELECGDYPDGRSVVVAGRDGVERVRRFASGYEREMWEIGMRESDFC